MTVRGLPTSTTLLVAKLRAYADVLECNSYEGRRLPHVLREAADTIETLTTSLGELRELPGVAERIAQAIEDAEARAVRYRDRTGDPYFAGQADGLRRAAAIAREHKETQQLDGGS